MRLAQLEMKLLASRRWRILVGFACTMAIATPVRAQERWEFTQIHMGVPVRIVAYGSEQEVRRAAMAAFARAADLDGKMSDYNPDSELRRATRHAGSWVPISGDLMAVLWRARSLARATGGTFDPTVGPVVRLWRDARRRATLPAGPVIDSARALVGWRHLQLDSSRSRLRLARGGMQLDLGGIAKGYIVQQMLAELQVARIRSALVEAGGDIAVGDAPPALAGWRIETPGANAAVSSRAARLTNACISTSGPTEQFVVIDGQRYSHVIDPRTGWALRSPDMATIVATDCATADALSTAMTILAPKERARVLRAHPGVIASVFPASDRSSTPRPMKQL